MGASPACHGLRISGAIGVTAARALGLRQGVEKLLGQRWAQPAVDGTSLGGLADAACLLLFW